MGKENRNEIKQHIKGIDIMKRTKKTHNKSDQIISYQTRSEKKERTACNKTPLA